MEMVRVRTCGHTWEVDSQYFSSFVRRIGHKNCNFVIVKSNKNIPTMKLKVHCSLNSL